MKKLSIKEKAKAYDEVLERAKEKYSIFEGMKQGDVLEDVFPELKESEDERIRKALIELIQGLYKGCCTEEARKERDMFLAWLEKQGKNNMGISEATKQVLEDNLNKALEKETPESCNEFLEEQGEQKLAWSEEDKTMVEDIIEAIDTQYAVTDYNEMVNWLKSLKDRYTWKPSELQIEALAIAIRCGIKLGTWEEEALKDLIEQLKRLKS